MDALTIALGMLRRHRDAGLIAAYLDLATGDTQEVAA